MRYLTLLLLAICTPLMAQAPAPVPVTIEWQWPELRCDGSVIFLDQIDQAEIYIATDPIPSASEENGDGPCGATEDVPPATAIVQTVSTDATSVSVDLPQGDTYFVRMRVQVNGEWSNFSAQAERTLDFARPNIPIIIRIGS